MTIPPPDRHSSPLFVPVDRSPPDNEDALEAVYQAFSAYDLVFPFCRQCFDLEDEMAMRRAKTPREAPYGLFRGIYFEHPACSGGLDTFKHWLPRQLELAFEDYDWFGDTLSTRLARLGMLTWPENEQMALRRLFMRAAMNWFGGGHFDPLGYNPGHSKNFVTGPYEGADSASGEIATILMLLRVDMADFFSWLMAPGSANQPARVWSCIEDCLGGVLGVDDSTYLVLEERTDEPAYRRALEALQRRSQTSVTRLLQPMDLAAIALKLMDSDPTTAKIIEECEAYLPVRGVQQTPAEQAHDEAAIALIVDGNASAVAN